MQRHGFHKSTDLIIIYDQQPQSKSSRERYDSVAPGHIPGICFSVDFTQDTEKLSLTIPSSIFELIPLFRDCPNSCRGVKATLNQETGDIERGADVKPALGHLQDSIELPGSLWDVLVDLKVVLEDGWDGMQLFLDPAAAIGALAGALQVNSNPRLRSTDAQCGVPTSLS